MKIDKTVGNNDIKLMENAMKSARVLLAYRQSRLSLGAPSYGGPSSVGKSSVVMLLQGKYAAQVDNDRS